MKNIPKNATMNAYPAGWRREHSDTASFIAAYDEHIMEMRASDPKFPHDRGLDAADISVQLDAEGEEAERLFLGRVLNQLRRWGYIKRLKTGYVPTDDGKVLP